MPNFYQVVVKGRASTQEFANVLYYVRQSDLGADFDTGEMGDLASRVVTMWQTQVNPVQASAYTNELVEVTVINELRETISPYGVIVPFTGIGSLAGDMPTLGATWIVGFRVTFLLANQTARVPRRSYLALGPITEGVIGTTGANQLGTSARENLETGLSQVLVGGLASYTPVRVGRLNAAGDPAYGKVVDALLRDFASFRRSRMIRPTGE